MATPKLKVGDRVVVSKIGSIYLGVIGTIEKCSCLFGDPANERYLVVFDPGDVYPRDLHERVWFSPESLTLAGREQEGPLEDAGSILRKAASIIEERGSQRDGSGAERSMARTVNTFNAMTGHELTEEEGWLFMQYLKDSRSRAGEFTADDYYDNVAYAGLRAECAIQAQNQVKE